MYEINKEYMRKMRDRYNQRCPCNTINQCPCNDFLDNDECKCGLYKKVDVNKK